MEIEPGCGKWAARISWASRINWAARIKWALNFKEIINGFLFSCNLIETFLKKGSFNTGGSINTTGSIYTGGSFSISRLNFHIPDIKKRDTFSVWLYKKFMFRWKRFTFLPSLRESILKYFHYFIIPRKRERKFFGAQFPHPRCGNWAARIKRVSSPEESYKVQFCRHKCINSINQTMCILLGHVDIFCIIYLFNLFNIWCFIWGELRMYRSHGGIP